MQPRLFHCSVNRLNQLRNYFFFASWIEFLWRAARPRRMEKRVEVFQDTRGKKIKKRRLGWKNKRTRNNKCQCIYGRLRVWTMQPHDDVSFRTFRSLVPPPLESFFPRWNNSVRVLCLSSERFSSRRWKMILKDFLSSYFDKVRQRSMRGEEGWNDKRIARRGRRDK